MWTDGVDADLVEARGVEGGPGAGEFVAHRQVDRCRHTKAVNGRIGLLERSKGGFGTNVRRERTIMCDSGREARRFSTLTESLPRDAVDHLGR